MTRPDLVVAAFDGKLSWYVSRASGIVAWGASTASILWGVAVTRRRGGRLDLHRFLGVLTIVFTALHLVALWADDFVEFGPSELFVPMASDYRPGAVAWGIIALYMLGAIMVTSWAMRWLPRRLWHGVHLSSYVVFATSTVHGYQAGTDRDHPLFLAGVVGGMALVVTMSAWRLRCSAGVPVVASSSAVRP